MASVHIHFEFSPAFLRWGSAVLLVFLGALELGTESLTLSTYYPAPSGVYNKMIATGDTFLARDGGKVGIGTTVPAEKLEVFGNIKLSGGTTSYRIVNVADPIDDSDVATKGWVLAQTSSGSGPGSWKCVSKTSGNQYSTVVSVACPANYTLIVGGCNGPAASGGPNDNGWTCICNNPGPQNCSTLFAYAWCCQ